MHILQDVDHAHLVLVSDMAIVKVFLNAKYCLRHSWLRRVHLQHAVYSDAVIHWVLTLTHEVFS